MGSDINSLRHPSTFTIRSQGPRALAFGVVFSAETETLLYKASGGLGMSREVVIAVGLDASHAQYWELSRVATMTGQALALLEDEPEAAVAHPSWYADAIEGETPSHRAGNSEPWITWKTALSRLDTWMKGILLEL